MKLTLHIMKLKFSFVDERKFEPCRRLGHFVFQAKKMQFRLSPFPPSPPPPHFAQCCVLQDKHPLHILHTLRTWTLFGGMGWKLIKAVFMSVYCGLASNSIQKTKNPCDQLTGNQFFDDDKVCLEPSLNLHETKKMGYHYKLGKAWRHSPGH